MSRSAPIGVEADPASTTRTDRVRALNDAFRRSFAGGHVMLSRGIAIGASHQRSFLGSSATSARGGNRTMAFRPEADVPHSAFREPHAS
ncbi:hypothetical protein ACYQR9_02045 [Methylobacterium sp. CM6241]